MLFRSVVGTGGGDANTTLVDVSNLAFAINATGQVSNLNPKALNRIAIKRIWGQGQIASNKIVTLQWGGVANSSIVTFGNGWFDYNFDSGSTQGTIEIPDPANSSGDIVFTSTAGAGDAFTLFIDLKKDGRDFDQGGDRKSTRLNSSH